jgi:hypothetical protein
MEKITNHSELLRQIAVLRADKNVQEVKLERTFKELANTLNFLSLFKSKSNRDQPLEFAKQGVTMAMDLIIDLIYGKNKGFKGFISSVLVEKIINFIIDHKFNDVIALFTGFFNKNPKTEPIQN